MKVLAPGKLVLTGAYAVLEGAPAIVIAVDRCAIVDTRAPDKADTRALYDGGGRKLGLGSSAASLVASFAARALTRGDDLCREAVRGDIFRAARAAHHRETGGGSGVDVAASVYGGALRYALPSRAAAPSSDLPDAALRSIEWPRGLVLAAFWSGISARTSELLGRVAALRARGTARSEFTTLNELAQEAADAVGEARTFVPKASAFGRALAALGDAADAPIVPPAFAALAAIAEDEGAAFLPSGAGGGDVAVWLGASAPSLDFMRRVEAFSLTPLSLAVDRLGVRQELFSS